MTEEKFNAYISHVNLIRCGKLVAKPRNYDKFMQMPLTLKDVFFK